MAVDLKIDVAPGIEVIPTGRALAANLVLSFERFSAI